MKSYGVASLLVVAAGLAGCGNGACDDETSLQALPAFDATMVPGVGSALAPPERIAGSSGTDIWMAFSTRNALDGMSFAPSIVHWDGARWAVMPLPGTPRDSTRATEAPTLVSAGADAVWALFTSAQYARLTVYRIGADGSAVDHSDEFAPGSQFQGAHLSPQGALYLQVGQSSPTHPSVLYAEHGGNFSVLMSLPMNSQVTVALSDTDIWVLHPPDMIHGLPTTYERLVAGAWVPFMQPLGLTTLLASPLVTGALGATGLYETGWPFGAAAEVWAPGPNGLGSSPTDGGAAAAVEPQTMGTVQHFDGTSFSSESFGALSFVSTTDSVTRSQLISVAPGVVAVLRTHLHEGRIDVESERWDGSHLSPPRVLIGNACPLAGLGRTGGALPPVVARLLDGTNIHAMTRNSPNRYQLLLARASDY